MDLYNRLVEEHKALYNTTARQRPCTSGYFSSQGVPLEGGNDVDLNLRLGAAISVLCVCGWAHGQTKPLPCPPVKAENWSHGADMMGAEQATRGVVGSGIRPASSSSLESRPPTTKIFRTVCRRSKFTDRHSKSRLARNGNRYCRHVGHKSTRCRSCRGYALGHLTVLVTANFPIPVRLRWVQRVYTPIRTRQLFRL